MKPMYVGMVGAGRSRNGLGPFLAEFLEAEGFVVTSVSGRSLLRTAANAEGLAQRLGHEVKAFASPAALCAGGVAALVITSPVQYHLEALRAGAKAGLPTLCEKPLVHVNDIKEGASIIEAFARKQIPLLENCQWPHVLPVFEDFYGVIGGGKEVEVEMGLAPPRITREIVQNTVSHLLSVIQAVVAVDPYTDVTHVSIDDPGYKGMHNALRFRLTGQERTVKGVLHLEICLAPPRPAWLAINGLRMDRIVREGYSIAFSANGREVSISDPMKSLVKRFALVMQSRDTSLMDFERNTVLARLDLYRQILGKLE